MRFISRWRFRQLVSRRRPASNRTLSRFEELEKRETPAALGVYALGNAYSTGDSLDPYFLQQARANANVDGIALRAKWDALESTDGQFTWNYFDTQVADATAAHKEVSLSVEAGTSTPPWVYADGVPAFNGSQKVPIPWNATYLNKWEQFIQALGQRYAGNPTVVQVKITGINSISQETALPYDSSSSADLNAWLAAGYTRTKVENAWTQIADTVARQFPQQQVAAMFRPDAFPPIDSNGRVIKDTSGQPAKADYQATTDLMTNGRSRYGVQFVIQNNALSPCFVWQNVVNLSQQVATGYQMLGAVTSDPAMTQCQSPPLAENVALQDAVNNAIKATPVNQAVPGNAKFLEIYAADVAAANQDSTLNAVLANAHTNLASHFSVNTV